MTPKAQCMVLSRSPGCQVCQPLHHNWHTTALEELEAGHLPGPCPTWVSVPILVHFHSGIGHITASTMLPKGPMVNLQVFWREVTDRNTTGYDLDNSHVSLYTNLLHLASLPWSGLGSNWLNVCRTVPVFPETNLSARCCCPTQSVTSSRSRGLGTWFHPRLSGTLDQSILMGGSLLPRTQRYRVDTIAQPHELSSPAPVQSAQQTHTSGGHVKTNVAARDSLTTPASLWATNFATNFATYGQG